MSSSRCTPLLPPLAGAGGAVSYVPAAATVGADAAGRSPMYTPFAGGGVTAGADVDASLAYRPPRIVGNVVTVGCVGAAGAGLAVMPDGAGVALAGAGVVLVLLLARLLGDEYTMPQPCFVVSCCCCALADAKNVMLDSSISPRYHIGRAPDNVRVVSALANVRPLRNASAKANETRLGLLLSYPRYNDMSPICADGNGGAGGRSCSLPPGGEPTSRAGAKRLRRRAAERRFDY